MTANTNMHNLTTLVKRYVRVQLLSTSFMPTRRLIAPLESLGSLLTGTCHPRLEAATSRLEDMATSIDSSHPSTVAAISGTGVASPGKSDTATPREAPPAEALPPSITDFDKFLDGDVKTFVEASQKIGGLVEQQVKLSNTDPL
jgi:hypothetical protein